MWKGVVSTVASSIFTLFQSLTRKQGTPIPDMSSDDTALGNSQTSWSTAPYQIKMDRILTKVVSSYSHFKPEISE